MQRPRPWSRPDLLEAKDKAKARPDHFETKAVVKARPV